MRNALVLAKKDSESYFHSWAGILILTFFILMTGIFFCIPLFTYAKISLNAAEQAQSLHGIGMSRFIFSSFFFNIGTLLIFIVPFLTMRSFAEERNSQTLELIFTYPLSDFEIVWGKFCGVLRIFLLLTLPTLAYTLIVKRLGGQIEWGTLGMGYLGFVLLGMSYIALGNFISSLSENPVASGIITFSILVVCWVLEWVASVMDGAWAHFFSALSPLSHYRDFTLGILDLSHGVYFLFFFLYFLFLTLRSIETRHWKG